jgi:bacterioferritin-associated ferredoxin
MELDDELCLCFHVTKRKVINYLRVQRPVAASQLSQCFGAGTGCGWCRPFLERLWKAHQMAQSAAGTVTGEATAAATRTASTPSGPRPLEEVELPAPDVYRAGRAVHLEHQRENRRKESSSEQQTRPPTATPDRGRTEGSDG